MKSVAILTFGTFCDIKLSLTIAREFLDKKKKVYFLTNTIPDEIKIIDENLIYMKNDLNKYIDLKNHNIAGEKIDLVKAVKYTPLVNYINNTLYKETSQILNQVDYIIVHYPALFLSTLLKNHKNKLGVFFVAPAYPNLQIPYIFSNEIREWSVSQYNSGNEKNYKSSIENMIKISSSSLNPSTVLDLMDNCDIFSMWDETILKPPKTVKQIYKLSNIFNRNIIKNISDEKITNFCENKNIVYISLGSLTDIPITSIKIIIVALIKSNYSVIYHGKIDINETEKFIKYDKYIPHEYIIPKCKLIVSSGSYCMTSLANYYGVYILHFPLSNEQLFWSKCYSYNTKTNFINPNDNYTVEEIQKTVSKITGSLKSRLYNLILRNSIRRKDSVKKLVEIINKKIEKNIVSFNL